MAFTTVPYHTNLAQFTKAEWDTYLADNINFLNGLGGRELDYATVTSNSAAISATTEGTSVAVITGNSVTYDGTKVMVVFFAPTVTPSGSGTPIFVLYRDSTVVGQIGKGTNSGTYATTIVTFDTPVAGAHTYSVKVFLSGGASPTVTVSAGVGGTGAASPVTLRVSKA